MKKNIENNKPSILLLIVLVGFPQISETIFSPSIPSISRAFGVPMDEAQWTMSIYFVAFAIGVYYFGTLSDRIGRRKAMLIGITLYIVGNLLCVLANDFTLLLIARFLQAFGASVGSIITQTILRESFNGVDRHKAFAQISAALAFTPAIGPLMGGFTNHYFGLQAVFLLLVGFSVILFATTYAMLPETITLPNNKKPLRPTLKRMIRDKRLWAYCLLIGGLNGIIFSYYSEAAFIFTKHYELSTATFGTLGIVVAIATVIGALTSKKLLKKFKAETIISIGIAIFLLGSLCALLVSYSPDKLQLLGLIISIFIILFGVGLALPNCLSLALVDFQQEIGTAGAIFSLMYYLLVSLIIYGMSYFHNGSITAMPMYFLLIGSIMMIVSVRKENK